MSQNVKEIKGDEFENLVLNSKRPVVVDFYSTECPPCEALAPKFDDMAEKFGGDVDFYKIFRQGNRELADRLNVKSSPTLLFFRDGKEAGERFSGGIRKRQIVDGMRNILPSDRVSELTRVLEKKRRRVDLAIVGGGPAGLSAAIYAAQARLSVLVIDQDLPGGQVKTTHLISNYPGTERALEGWELAHRMESQAKESGAEFLSAVDVEELDISATPRRILVDGDTEILADAVILAGGAEPRLLGVPGEKELRGRGISYCATCDGKYYDGKEIFVIGGGNSAVEESIFLTRFASKITIVHQFDHLQANKAAQEHVFAESKIQILWDSEPRKFELLNDGRMKITLENVKTKEESIHTTDGVFIFVGMAPSTASIQGDLKKDDYGYIQTNEDMQTAIPGVFAAGDIRSKKIRQAVTAASDGCIAAIYAERYLSSLKEKV